MESDMRDEQGSDSGFVPIRFRIAGWGMLALGLISLAVYVAVHFFGETPLPRTLMLFGIFAILTGFYLRFVIPRR
jgi:hypothetical protein